MISELRTIQLNLRRPISVEGLQISERDERTKNETKSNLHFRPNLTTHKRNLLPRSEKEGFLKRSEEKV